MSNPSNKSRDRQPQMVKSERTRYGIRDEIAIRLFVEKIMEFGGDRPDFHARMSLEQADRFLDARDNWKSGVDRVNHD